MTNLVLPNGIVVDDILFTRIMENCKKIVKDAAPNPQTRYKTSWGDLALKSIKIVDEDRRKMRFTIVVDEDIAPYARYVTKKTHWKDGRPYEYNEWFEKAAKEVAEYVAKVCGGKVIKS